MTNPIRTGHEGVSLVELMVALAIGSLLVLGLVQVFAASRAAYQMSEGIARVQENARFAMDFLQRDIRMAGHFGCVNDQAHLVRGEGDPRPHFGAIVPGEGHPLDFTVSIQGYEAFETGPTDSVTLGAARPDQWAPDLPGEIIDLDPLPGSDIIVLRYLGARGTPILSIGAGGSDILEIPPAPPAGSPDAPAEGWPILTDEGVTNPTLFGIADCSHADVFPGQGVAGNVEVGDSSITPLLANRYNAHPAGQTQLYRANSIVYYVSEGAAGVPALHRARFNGGAYSAEELVEGIESLQLMFGLDESSPITPTNPPVGNISELQTAEFLGKSVPQWHRVGLVRVGLLVSSPETAAAPQAVAGDATDLRVLGLRYEQGATNDGRYRSAYEATISARNRLFGN